MAWTICLRRQHGMDPIFAHVNKDITEIGCLREVWNAKISFCWWHLRHAVCTRLAKAKLSTTPYNVKRAHEEFPFINLNSIPSRTRVDVTDYKALEKLPIAYALGFRRQPSKLHLELQQRRVSQQTRKIMSQRELAGHIPQSRELDSCSVSTPTPQLQCHLRPTKLPENQEEPSDEERGKPRYLLSCRLGRGYRRHDGTSMRPSGDSRICTRS